MENVAANAAMGEPWRMPDGEGAAADNQAGMALDALATQAESTDPVGADAGAGGAPYDYEEDIARETSQADREQARAWADAWAAWLSAARAAEDRIRMAGQAPSTQSLRRALEGAAAPPMNAQIKPIRAIRDDGVPMPDRQIRVDAVEAAAYMRMTPAEAAEYAAMHPEYLGMDAYGQCRMECRWPYYKACMRMPMETFLAVYEPRCAARAIMAAFRAGTTVLEFPDIPGKRVQVKYSPLEFTGKKKRKKTARKQAKGAAGGVQPNGAAGDEDDEDPRFVAVDSPDRKWAKRAMCNLLAGYIGACIMEIMSGASAKQMPNRRYEEMLAEGALAVVSSMWKYDPEKGRPTTFFKLPIRHVLVAYANHATTGVTSRNEAARVTKVKQSCANLVRSGLPPTAEAVSADTGYPLNDVITLLEMIQTGRMVYLDAPTSSDDESPMGDRILARDGNPFLAAAASEWNGVIRKALEELGEREREFFLASTIGVVDMETGRRKVMSATALGLKHGITTHAADVIIANARRRLRENKGILKYYQIREGVQQEDPTFGQLDTPAADFFDYLDQGAESIEMRAANIDGRVTMRFKFQKG